MDSPVKKPRKSGPSKAKCIREKCKDCIYDPKSRGTWRAQVGACTVTACPLYPVRPMPSKREQAGSDSDDDFIEDLEADNEDLEDVEDLDDLDD